MCARQRHYHNRPTVTVAHFGSSQPPGDTVPTCWRTHPLAETRSQPQRISTVTQATRLSTIRASQTRGAARDVKASQRRPGKPGSTPINSFRNEPRGGPCGAPRRQTSPLEAGRLAPRPRASPGLFSAESLRTSEVFCLRDRTTVRSLTLRAVVAVGRCDQSNCRRPNNAVAAHCWDRGTNPPGRQAVAVATLARNQLGAPGQRSR